MPPQSEIRVRSRKNQEESGRLTPREEALKALSERSLERFLTEAWHVLEPSTPFAPDWYIGYLCEYLEAVTLGQIKDLVVCIPPRHTKSLIFSICWPAWEWGPRDLAHTKWIHTSYGDILVTDLSVKRRNLMQSPWYRRRWGDRFDLAGDMNLKREYHNNRGGEMLASPILGQIMGRGANRVLIDDPIDPTGVESELDRQNVMRVIKKTLPSRLNNPTRDSQICVMQRLDLKDPAAYFMDQGFTAVEIAGHARPGNGHAYPKTYSYPVSGRTHTVKEGDILSPDRFNAEVHEKIKKRMGPQTYSAQFDQKPVPGEGGIFDRAWFKLRAVPPHHGFAKKYRAWDRAGTEGGGKRTAGVLVAKGWDNAFWILHVRKGQWGAANRDQEIANQMRLDGIDTEVIIEQEPNQAGGETVDITIRNNPGFIIHKERVSGSKVQRARSFASQANAGNVYVLADGSWDVDNYLEELHNFPYGEFCDQVDGTTTGYIYLALLPDSGVYVAEPDGRSGDGPTPRMIPDEPPTPLDWSHASERFR